MSFHNFEKSEPRWKVIGLWVVTGLLSAMFLFSGAAKLMGMQMHVENFARWGYPEWFRLLIGFVEVTAGVALLWKAIAPYAAGVLGVIMAGAIYTHLANNEAMMSVMPFMFLGLLFLVGWVRRPDWLRKFTEGYKLANGRKSG